MRAVSLLLVLLSSFAAAPADSAGAERHRKSGGSSAPLLEAEAARASGLSEAEVKDATKLYTTKCMRCHKSYEPVAYSQPLWDSWMFKMRKKAHLGPAQEALLHRYLDAYRANSPMAKTNSATGGKSEAQAPRSQN
jgi:hypothetical protein